MSTMTMVALIVVTALAGEAFRNWIKYKERTARRAESQDGGELAALRERVEVLERIVTDRGYDLRHEIDALDRAPRRPAAATADDGFRAGGRAL